eukprot:gene24220-biopygen19404
MNNRTRATATVAGTAATVARRSNGGRGRAHPSRVTDARAHETAVEVIGEHTCPDILDALCAQQLGVVRAFLYISIFHSRRTGIPALNTGFGGPRGPARPGPGTGRSTDGRGPNVPVPAGPTSPDWAHLWRQSAGPDQAGPLTLGGGTLLYTASQRSGVHTSAGTRSGVRTSAGTRSGVCTSAGTRLGVRTSTRAAPPPRWAGKSRLF